MKCPGKDDFGCRLRDSSVDTNRLSWNDINNFMSFRTTAGSEESLRGNRRIRPSSGKINGWYVSIRTDLGVAPGIPRSTQTVSLGMTLTISCHSERPLRLYSVQAREPPLLWSDHVSGGPSTLLRTSVGAASAVV
jgi:hypothetical protein